jgi:rRNA maturation endonuclease Nob1
MAEEKPQRAEAKRECQGCHSKVPVSQLYYVREKWVCERCGQREVEEWNRLVRESVSGA